MAFFGAISAETTIYINDIVGGVGSKKSREHVKVRSCDLKFPTHLNQNP